MASPPNVELEAVKFLHKLNQESADEPTKLATKLYVISQHMRSSGKETTMPYQVISRAMEITINQHGLDIEALIASLPPLTSGTRAGNFPASLVAGSSQRAPVEHSKESIGEDELTNIVTLSSRPPISPSSSGNDIYQGSVSHLDVSKHACSGDFNIDELDQMMGSSISQHVKKRNSSMEVPPIVEVDVFDGMNCDNIKKKLLAIVSSACDTMGGLVDDANGETDREKKNAKAAGEGAVAWRHKYEAMIPRLNFYENECRKLKAEMAVMMEDHTKAIEKSRKSACKSVTQARIRMIEEFQRGETGGWDLDAQKEILHQLVNAMDTEELLPREEKKDEVDVKNNDDGGDEKDGNTFSAADVAVEK